MKMAGNDAVSVTRNSKVWTVTISRPERRNALDDHTIDSLMGTIKEAEAGGDVAGLIITGAGDRAFCAGSDLKALAGLNRSEAARHTRMGQLLMDAIETSSLITVAAVEGFALGGGFELALACDLIVAGSSATFGLPELSKGMVPAWGGTYRLSRAIGLNPARAVILGGRRLDAGTAHALGLVTAIAEDGSTVSVARDLLSVVLQHVEPSVIGIVKQMLLSGAVADGASASLAERLTETMLSFASDYGVERV
ncbi:enoyl-CoA hydratase/isomerase family protein [Arthrobacter sp. NyZ413]|uniref:enoyl-CoA hydratase/isomerase family protein n=1 Tax=Arthrobacter sp. NyZ413 TaxID=3144669 RepID=UPI003BF7B6B5